MTSSLGRDKVIPLRTSFDEESLQLKKQKKPKTVKEEGIRPLHEKGLDSDDRKDHKKKKEKKGEESSKREQRTKEKQEKWRSEPETKPETRHTPSPYLFPPQRKIYDDECSRDDIEPRHEKGRYGDNVAVSRDSNCNVQLKSDCPSYERRACSQKEPNQEKEWDESSDIIMIRAAIRRDFHDDKHEQDSKRCRHERGNTCGLKVKGDERALRERDKHSRETCRKNDFLRDACTATKDSLFAPCQFLFGSKKESFKDLCEARKDGECGAGNYDRCSDKCHGNDHDERTNQDLRRRDTAMFSRQSFSSNARGEYAEGKGDDWKDTSRRSSKDTSADEMTHLKNDLAKLQTELDRLKECLKAAAIAAEKNKCTITKMREHIRCSFPCCLLDCARIREKLKNCNLMKMRLCQEFKVSPNQDCWRRDFECLKDELGTIKCELEKIRRDKK